MFSVHLILRKVEIEHVIFKPLKQKKETKNFNQQKLKMKEKEEAMQWWLIGKKVTGMGTVISYQISGNKIKVVILK